MEATALLTFTVRNICQKVALTVATADAADTSDRKSVV